MPQQFTLRTYSNDEALVKERRNQIVRCSTKVFTRKGYDQTSMREIIRACGMSAGKLYHYFGSKEEILYSILDNATSQQAQYIEDSAGELETVKPALALEKLMSKHFKWHDNYQDSTVFAYQETKNLPANARQNIFDSEGRIVTAFKKLLLRGIEAGQFSIDNPEVLAHDIVVLGHAWAFRRWHLRKCCSFETYLRTQTKLILKAVKKERNTTKRRRKEMFK